MVHIKKLIIFLLVTVIALPFSGCNNQKVEKGNNAQYTVAFNGQTFEFASDFDAGLTVVGNDNEFYFIDTDGAKIAKLPSKSEFEQNYNNGKNISYVSYYYKGQGVCYAETGGIVDTVLFDSQGKGIKTDLQIDIGDTGYYFHDGLIIVDGSTNDKDIQEVKDIQGNTILQYAGILDYLGNIQFGYLEDNTLILPQELDFLEGKPIYKASSIVYANGDIELSPLTYYIDANGNNIKSNDGSHLITDSIELSGTKKNMLIFYDGMAINDVNNQQYRDTQGKFYVMNDAEWPLQNFSEGYAVITVDGQYGFIDTKGTKAVQPQFKWASSVNNGLALVQLWDETYQYIIIGNPSINKVDLQKNTILFDESIQKDVKSNTDMSDYKGIDLLADRLT